MAALFLLSLPYLTSITDIYVARALHLVRVQLPARYLQHAYQRRQFKADLPATYFPGSETEIILVKLVLVKDPHIRIKTVYFG